MNKIDWFDLIMFSVPFAVVGTVIWFYLTYHI